MKHGIQIFLITLAALTLLALALGAQTSPSIHDSVINAR